VYLENPYKNIQLFNFYEFFLKNTHFRAFSEKFGNSSFFLDKKINSLIHACIFIKKILDMA